ncbi:MAG: SHD1 domain-containing protein [Pirellulales bacterium]
MPPAPGGADRARPAPADRDLEPSPSDRGDSAPLEPDRGTSPRDTDPMPPTDSTEPAPSPFENPFSQPRGDEPPAAAEDTAPALDNRAPPAPGVTEPDNPFAPRPGATETTPPAETTPAPDADNPFAPRDSAPPAPADENNPFAPRTGAADAPEATESSRTTPPVEDLFAPRTTDTQPPADNPFAPRPADTGSTADDPFRLPVDTAKPPMSAVNEAPMNDAPATPMNDANDGTSDPAPATESMPQPALDNPFAPPAPDRVSTTNRAPELADAMRVWTDITGKHQVRGQMKRILVAERKVRILKETGKYTTVPFAKLSVADRTFVARHAIEPSTLLAETR